jgi:hypothetical protein
MVSQDALKSTVGQSEEMERAKRALAENPDAPPTGVRMFRDVEAGEWESSGRRRQGVGFTGDRAGQRRCWDGTTAHNGNPAEGGEFRAGKTRPGWDGISLGQGF